MEVVTESENKEDKSTVNIKCHVAASVSYSPAEKMEGIFVKSRGRPAGSVGGDKMGAIEMTVLDK